MRPHVRSARENRLSERQNAFHVEFIDRCGVPVDPRRRKLLMQSVALPSVRVVVDRLCEQKRIVETIQPLLHHLHAVEVDYPREASRE